MTSDKPSILERLRSETRPQHDRLEEVAGSEKLATGTLSPAEYLKLLKANYVAHRRLEGAVLDMPEMKKLLADRQKASLLEADLRQAGIDPDLTWEELEQVLPPLQLQNQHQALGAQYVMEGATLGGVVILRALLQHPQLQALQPFHYYGCYGGDNGKRWSQFRKIMLALVQSPQEEEEILKGSLSAYQYFEKAFIAVQV
jgi:heme oxygenase